MIHIFNFYIIYIYIIYTYFFQTHDLRKMLSVRFGNLIW